MFEIKRDGKTVCRGDVECLPNSQTIKSMKAAGLKIYVDGKIYKEEKQ